MNGKLFSLVPGLFLCGILNAPAHARDKTLVVLTKTPGGGIQPQSVVDEHGNLHVLYFKGEPAGGDLYYAQRRRGEKTFARGLRVNSQPGSAIAVGTIRGGQIALGKNGRVHVAWNGSGRSLPKGPGEGTPMLYARLNESGTAFEPQRNLMKLSEVLDGGGSVAADHAGNVYVVWHGRRIGGTAGEEHRQVWVARSHDDGQTFAAEIAAFSQATGACGCCGLRTFADRKGNAYVIYRAAGESIHRDMWLLASVDAGRSFQGSLLHRWSLDACPMSSEAFAEGPKQIYVAWETKGQVYMATIEPGTAKIGRISAAPGKTGGRKHPALAANKRGEILLAWTEGTGWQRGGALAWQIFDADGQPTGEQGRVPGGIPIWGLPAAAAAPDGSFEILH
jgi:hypothetical protein